MSLKDRLKERRCKPIQIKIEKVLRKNNFEHMELELFYKPLIPHILLNCRKIKEIYILTFIREFLRDDDFVKIPATIRKILMPGLTQLDYQIVQSCICPSKDLSNMELISFLQYYLNINKLEAEKIIFEKLT